VFNFVTEEFVKLAEM